MTIMEGIKSLTGRPAIIPGAHRAMLPGFFKELGFKVGAEIGVHKGEFTKEFCKAGLKMYAIDPWMAYRGAGRGLLQQQVQDHCYEEAVENLSGYDCTIIRKKSMEAIYDFPKYSLDFVYIDGDHSLRAVIDDILGWLRRIRTGGIISGHDYLNSKPGATNTVCHVKMAVDDCVHVLGVQNFYVTGDLKTDGKDPSWFWFQK